MDARGGKLITADEPTIVTEPFLDAVVVEGSECDGRFANSACTDESDRHNVFCERNDGFDQFVASEAVPRRAGRQLSRGKAR